MSRTIAIVEDEPAIRANYVDALSRYGYRVLAFANRPEAQQAFALQLPDLVIIDVGLGMSRKAVSICAANCAHARRRCRFCF